MFMMMKKSIRANYVMHMDCLLKAWHYERNDNEIMYAFLRATETIAFVNDIRISSSRIESVKNWLCKKKAYYRDRIEYMGANKIYYIECHKQSTNPFRCLRECVIYTLKCVG